MEWIIGTAVVGAFAWWMHRVTTKAMIEIDAAKAFTYSGYLTNENGRIKLVNTGKYLDEVFPEGHYWTNWIVWETS